MSIKTIVIIVIIILVLIAIIITYKKIDNRIQAKKAENAFNQSAIQGNIGGQMYSINTASIAQQIYDAFYGNDWFGASEDEEAAIVAISNVPKQFIPLVTETYYNLYKKNLNGDFVKFLDKKDYDRVKPLFN